MTLEDKKISKIRLAELLGCPIDQIVTKYVSMTFYVLDEDGNQVMVGPSFASQPKIETYRMELTEAGRPVGTTIANGAAAKRKLKKTKLELQREAEEAAAAEAAKYQNMTSEEEAAMILASSALAPEKK